jgi:peptidoglycan/xylan/chitin deacetylase (PgdA/CDA1 family)
MRLIAPLLLIPALAASLPAPPVPEDHRDVYIYNGRRDSNLLALTYDDGPHHQRTPQLMTLLGELDCPATFFVLGEAAQRNPLSTGALVASGFEVGNHSMTHANLRQRDRAQIEQEIDQTEALLEQAGSEGSTLFRPPYGSSNRTVVEEAYGERGMEIVNWSLDTEDWKTDVTADQIIENILANVQGGDIVLMHDIHSKAIPVTRAIVPALRERGFEFVSVSALMEDLRTHVPEETTPSAVSPE